MRGGGREGGREGGLRLSTSVSEWVRAIYCDFFCGLIVVVVGRGGAAGGGGGEDTCPSCMPMALIVAALTSSPAVRIDDTKAPDGGGGVRVGWVGREQGWGSVCGGECVGECVWGGWGESQDGGEGGAESRHSLMTLTHPHTHWPAS